MRYFLIFELVLLTEVEKAYLTGTRQFTSDQGYYIKSRLLKNLGVYTGTDLPLLAKNDILHLIARIILQPAARRLLRIMMI